MILATFHYRRIKRFLVQFKSPVHFPPDIISDPYVLSWSKVSN